MNIIIIFKYAYNSLLSQKLRTMLSIIAIAIGMFSVFFFDWNLNGINQQIQKTAFQFGTDLIVIVPTQVSGNILTSARRTNIIPIRESFNAKDINGIKLINGISKVSGFIGGLTNVSYLGEVKILNVVGMYKEDIDIIPNIEVERGRWLINKGEVVVGARITQLFKEQSIDVGKTIKINNKTFVIVGILKPSGSFLQSLDDRLILNIDDARQVLSDAVKNNEFSIIIVKAGNSNNIKAISEQIDSVLAKNKMSDRLKGYTIITADVINENVNMLIAVVNLFFILISSISIIVGVINLGNSFYMAVIDKTREIATLRALGVTIDEMRRILYVQAIMICSISIFLGYGLAFIIGSLQGFVPFSPDYPILVFFAFFVLIISIIVAFLSSSEIVKLKPAQALRYE
ncbi:MAG: ABC transporter permease [Candidatus Anstonellales archaeon]